MQIVMLKHRAEVQRQSNCFATSGTYTELPISFLTFFFQWLHKLLTLCALENAKLQSTVTGIYNSNLLSTHLIHSTTVWVCQGRSYTKQGRCLFHSALS